MSQSELKLLVGNAILAFSDLGDLCVSGDGTKGASQVISNK